MTDQCVRGLTKSQPNRSCCMHSTILIPTQSTYKSIKQKQKTVSGKIYAPELIDMTLDILIEEQRPAGIIAAKKLLKDPIKAYIPLILVTFLHRVTRQNHDREIILQARYICSTASTLFKCY